MIGTVPIGVRESLLALGRRAHERSLAGVQSLVRFQLSTLGEGSMATRIVAGIGTFAWKTKQAITIRRTYS